MHNSTLVHNRETAINVSHKVVDKIQRDFHCTAAFISTQRNWDNITAQRRIDLNDLSLIQTDELLSNEFDYLMHNIRFVTNPDYLKDSKYIELIYADCEPQINIADYRNGRCVNFASVQIKPVIEEHKNFKGEAEFLATGEYYIDTYTAYGGRGFKWLMAIRDKWKNIVKSIYGRK